MVGGVGGGGGGGGRPSLGRARLRHRGRPMAALFQARPPTPRNTRPYTPPLALRNTVIFTPPPTLIKKTKNRYASRLN